MKYEYVTVVAESAADFSAALNKYGKQGYYVSKFEYSEYPTRGEGGKVDIYQTYVAVMERALQVEEKATEEVPAA